MQSNLLRSVQPDVTWPSSYVCDQACRGESCNNAEHTNQLKGTSKETSPDPDPNPNVTLTNPGPYLVTLESLHKTITVRVRIKAKLTL